MVGDPLMPEDFTHFYYANPEAPKGGELHQAIFGTFDTLNPFSLKGKSAQNLNLVYDRLMARSWDEPFTLYPLIAESIDIPDDRSSMTVHLNPKALFQDGSPITTDDAIFSFELLREKGRPNMRNVYKFVEKVTQIDNRTFRFDLKEGYTRETVMILAMMPILSKSWWEKRDFNTTILDSPNTSGPYRIKEVSVGRRIVMERNPNYWAKDLPVNKGLHNFDRIVFDYFRDQTSAFEAFKSGDIHIWNDLNPGHWNNAYDFPAFTAGHVSKEELKHGRVERAWGAIFNLRRAPFDNIKVREAISLMMDYDWINKNIFYGKFKPLDSFYPNSELAAHGEPTPQERDVLLPFTSTLPNVIWASSFSPPPTGDLRKSRENWIKADKLLSESGYLVQKGMRTNTTTGKPLTFEILVGVAEDNKIAQSLARNLEKIGIKVTIRNLDQAAFQDRLMDYDYDLVIHFWQNTLSPGTEQAVYWGCEAAKQSGRFNYAGICHPAVEKILGNIPNVTTKEELLTQVHALDRILLAERIFIPLFYNGADYVAAWDDYAHPTRISLYGNVLETWWYVPKTKYPANRD